MSRVHTRCCLFTLTLTLCLQISTSATFAQGVSKPPTPALQAQITAPTPFEEFARKLIAANSDAERATMLAAKKELVTPELSKAIHTEADREREKGNSARAFEIYQLAKSVAEQIKDTAGIANALEEIGLAYYNRGDYDAAMKTLKETLRLQEQLKDVRQQAGALNQIGMVHRAKGEYSQAIESYQQAQALNSSLADKKVLLQTLVNLGIVYRVQGNYGAALQTYQHALKVQEELGDKGALVLLLNGIGNVYWSQGDYAQAIEHFQKSLKLAEELKQTRVVATLLNNLGESYASAGDYETALVYYGKSLTLTEASKDKRQLASILSNMGGIERQRGATARALEFYQKSLDLRKELKDKAGIAEALERLALLHSERGNNAEALQLVERAASIAKEIGKRETLWQAHATAGKVYRALKRLPEARGAFDEAIDIIEDLRRQVAGGEESRQRYFEDKVSPYYEMADLLVGENKLGEALRYAEQAKARVLLDVLRGGRVEINKALTLQERQRERELSSELTVLNKQVAREREKPDAARLKELLARQQKARLDYEGFQANIYAAHSELAVQRGEAHPVTLDELSAFVPDAKTALVEFVVGEDHSLAFVITKSDQSRQSQSKAAPELRVYTLNIKRADLTKRIANFRQQLAARDLSFSVEAKELYQMLLAPVAAQLQDRTRLILVPDGALWELPFQTLLSPQNEYVVERQALSYAPSLSVLREMVRRRETRGTNQAGKTTLLAFGNPVTDGVREQGNLNARNNAERAPNEQTVLTATNTFTTLPEAERQVRALATLFGPSRSRIYTGKEALEEKLKREAGSYRIVHLATHGVLDDASPLYSYVLLNGSAGEANPQGGIKISGATPTAAREDGLLEAWELMQLNLRTDMVVLSACETARGRIGQGEGMIGLSWALFVAGSPTTVASQWKVESASTTELMLSFYRHLQSTPVRSAAGNVFKAETKAEALRQASLSLLRSERYSHPFYWAGFVIIGDSN